MKKNIKIIEINRQNDSNFDKHYFDPLKSVWYEDEFTTDLNSSTINLELNQTQVNNENEVFFNNNLINSSKSKISDSKANSEYFDIVHNTSLNVLEPDEVSQSNSQLPKDILDLRKESFLAEMKSKKNSTITSFQKQELNSSQQEHTEQNFIRNEQLKYSNLQTPFKNVIDEITVPDKNVIENREFLTNNKFEGQFDNYNIVTKDINQIQDLNKKRVSYNNSQSQFGQKVKPGNNVSSLFSNEEVESIFVNQKSIKPNRTSQVVNPFPLPSGASKTKYEYDLNGIFINPKNKPPLSKVKKQVIIPNEKNHNSYQNRIIYNYHEQGSHPAKKVLSNVFKKQNNLEQLNFNKPIINDLDFTTNFNDDDFNDVVQSRRHKLPLDDLNFFNNHANSTTEILRSLSQNLAPNSINSDYTSENFDDFENWFKNNRDAKKIKKITQKENRLLTKINK
ncbi:hypothetical protein SSABA_v1c02920 [Spiroplasma sabaudiense Ar-1343]|uniref:Uncharacterized protein n=1 Tax=Spiroplasma sabaudiense Ar-1343 TaxID=1276257 RepID=W6AJ30_9MOLU|nr:hypothetical protein [Spiroplasma sabaudiense]AHI53704.1 hypothetical protein SSABA_v1c02920 [Spiroplasma sabaudiense Ar-1343]